MNIIPTEIEGLVIIEPRVYGDARGYFFESYNREAYQAVTQTEFVQDNESRSTYGVVRGLHFQMPPYAQAKLVRCVEGSVLDVAVDLRRHSPTYGRHVAVELSAENHRQLYLPRGMAHGFAVLSPTALFQYKCDTFYHPEAEAAIRWDDPTLAIDWQVPAAQVLLSEKDRHHPDFATFNTPFE